MLVSSAAFQLDRATSTEVLLDGLAALMPCRHVEEGLRRSVVYDTRDERLRRAGLLLWIEQLDERTRLHWQGAAVGAAGQVDRDAGAPLEFAWDLPAECRAGLAAALGPRRLTPVLELERVERGLDVLDDQGKVVARVRLPQARARAAGESEWTPLPPLLTVDGVRGYAAALEEVLLVVSTRPGLLPASDGPASLESLRAAQPLQPPRAALPLREDLRADAGLQLILRALLDELESNERGVHDDIDTEYLHDYRVALRRTRTLLRQFRSVLPAGLVARVRSDFDWLGRASNAVRDLDVFLLWLRDQPSDPALAPVVAALERRRHAAQALLVADLDSPRYRALIDGWHAALQGPPTPPGEPAPQRAAHPLGAVVARRIKRAYRRMLDVGEGLDAGSPASELHGLRIRAKHLRYILDATAPLHDGPVHERLVGGLKKLQTVLGECHDASVQRATLDAIAAELDPGHGAAGLLALGRLQARLEDRERRAREKVAEHLERLQSGKLRDAVRELARRPPEGSP
jgi:CHAD domain-containing protein